MWKERAQHKHLDWVMFTLLYRIVVLNPLRHPDKVLLICYLNLDSAQVDLRKNWNSLAGPNIQYMHIHNYILSDMGQKKKPQKYTWAYMN